MPQTTPNMGLRVWDTPDDTFESEHLASNFAKLDFHDHSGGRGSQIPTEGFANLSISSAKLSNTATVKGVGSFSVYRATALTAIATGSELIFNNEEWDLSGWYDQGNGRYTPQVAGYYRFSTTLSTDTDLAASGYFEAGFAKNGTISKYTNRHVQPTASQPTVDFRVTGSACISLNGTTDYVSIKTASTANIDAIHGAATFNFQGELIGRS